MTHLQTSLENKVCITGITSGITSPYIQFTDEIEENQILSFLNVLITVTGSNKLETPVFRKATNIILYINWMEQGNIKEFHTKIDFNLLGSKVA